MTPMFKIEQYSHFFILKNPPPRINGLLKSFCHKLVHVTLIKKPRVGFVMAPTKVYAARLKNDSEYRFHINLLDELKDFLKNNYVYEDFYTIEKIPLYKPLAINAKVKKNWSARDYQQPIIDYLVAEKAYRSKLVGMRTGRGKGFVSLAAIAEIGTRTVILIKSSYIEKWCVEILEKLDLKTKDLVTVAGSNQLKGLINLAVNNQLTAKIIIISINTYINFIDNYEITQGDIASSGYECTPDNFFTTLQAGVLLIDEVHQQFYTVFKVNLYTHVPLLIGLSATLFSDDRFISRMHKVVFPITERYVEENITNYIKAYGVSYNFNHPERIRCMAYGSTIYSHHEFEKSIIRQPYILKNYLKLIDYIVKIGYENHYLKKDKLAIFAVSIDLCTILTNHYKNKFPQLDVRRYIEDDPYENVIDADIRISTIGSGGTAVDIPNLRCVIQTVNILSIQSNIQTIGRLRELPDRDVKFYYLWCPQLPKHKVYHERRIDMLADFTSSIKQFVYPGIV